jgi:uncharacterized protein YqhQ
MLGRRGALAFAQSVKTLCRLWCTSKDENATNKVYYSAIVNAGGNYSLKDNVFISLPVVFANGSFDYVKNYKISQQTQSILEEIIRVFIIVIHTFSISTVEFCEFADFSHNHKKRYLLNSRIRIN